MRLIDADEIRKKAVPHTRGEHGYKANIRKWAVLVGDIDDAPTIDAVPVVRCKDCKYKADYFNSGNYVCKRNQCTVCGRNSFIRDDDFCSYGKRKDGDGK